MKVIFIVIINTVADLAGIVVLLVLFVFIFALLGMQLFGGVIGTAEEIDGELAVGDCDILLPHLSFSCSP